MTEQQAQALAAKIQAQFPHVFVHHVDSIDTRNAPMHWFVAVKLTPMGAERALILHSELDYADALTALHILGGIDIEPDEVFLRTDKFSSL